MAYSAQNDPQMKELIASQAIRDELINEIVANVKVLHEMEKDPVKAQKADLYKLIALGVKTFLYHNLALRTPGGKNRVSNSELVSQGNIIALSLIQSYNGSITTTMINLLEQANNYAIAIQNRVNAGNQNGQRSNPNTK